MATETLYSPNRYSGDTTFLAQYYGLQTSTTFQILSGNGQLINQITGKDFEYSSNGFYSSGTETGSVDFQDDGSVSLVITGEDVDVETRHDLLTIGTSGYAYFQYVFRGNDIFNGSSGDDQFNGSVGKDKINGGAGSDLLSYDGFGESVVINLGKGTAVTADGTAKLTGIEDIAGTAYDDTLIGSSGDNVIQGFAGDDVIDGKKGIDTVLYGDASSAVTVDLSKGIATGGSGSDSLKSIEGVVGSRFDDTLIGSKHDDVLVGGLGDDTIAGGAGSDTVLYEGVGQGVVVDLAKGTASGGGGDDVLKSIENVTGSVFADKLTGSGAANMISGGAGDDKLHGAAGADVLTGGAGKDTMEGGSGKDHFVFAGDDFAGTTSAKADRILDFTHGDIIDLKAVDAKDGGSDNAFNFIGTKAFGGHAGELHVSDDGSNTLVTGDTDGDKVADFMIRLDGHVTLSATDFVL